MPSYLRRFAQIPTYVNIYLYYKVTNALDAAAAAAILIPYSIPSQPVDLGNDTAKDILAANKCESHEGFQPLQPV